MSLTIYGSPRSRTMRVLWMATELDLEYHQVPYGADDPALKRQPFVGINPAGAVPTIVDDGFALSESLAINLYLARKYSRSDGVDLYPHTLEGEADAQRWTLWAQASLESWVQRDAAVLELLASVRPRADALVSRAMAILDQVLATRTWLLGDRFTVADLNVAGVLSPSRACRLDLEACPNVARWLTRCYARPAAIETRRRFAS